MIELFMKSLPSIPLLRRYGMTSSKWIVLLSYRAKPIHEITSKTPVGGHEGSEIDSTAKILQAHVAAEERATAAGGGS